MAESRGGNNAMGGKPRDPWLRKQWERAHGAGKGDERRPEEKRRFDENYERIFGKREVKTWVPEDGDDPRKEGDAPRVEADRRAAGAEDTGPGASGPLDADGHREPPQGPEQDVA